MKLKIPIIIIELDANGVHILLDCKIGKSMQDAYIIIDTGASKSVIDSSTITTDDYTVIETEKIESSQLTEMVSGQIISIRNIQLGKFNFTNFEALTMPLNHINSIYSKFVNKPIAGLLGGDFLIKHKVVINYKMRRIEVTI